MNITRRFFLQSTGAVAVSCALSPLGAFAAEPAAAVAAKRRKTLVAVFLRGGCDGLNLVVPHGDPAYAALRRQLAIAAPSKENDKSAIDLDGYFGLHPRLGALAPLFASGVAVASHAVGYDKNSRSHFEEQDVWETGVVGHTLSSDGWLNRYLATSRGAGPLRAVAVGDTLPRILRGTAPAYAIRGVEDLALPNLKGDRAAVAAGLERAYQAQSPANDSARALLADTGRATLDAVRQLQHLTSAEYKPAAAYPNSDLARKLQQVARLIKADVGLEVAEVDLDGWDTHQGQSYGDGLQGQFGNLCEQLGGALAAFAADLGDRLDDVLVVTLSDFGRTAATNGTSGTDHGWGNALLALGGPVRRAARGDARPVVTQWPGLAPEQLHDGRDLMHVTDFRDVLAEAVTIHLGYPDAGLLLPDRVCKPVGLFA